jgi:TPR repeat protein
MAVASFFNKSRNGSLPKESSAAAETTAPSKKVKVENVGEPEIVVHDPVREVQHALAESPVTTQPPAATEQVKVENAAERDVVRDPPRRVQRVVAANLETAQKTGAAKENDPVGLWNAVKRGSVSAEVALANLYLEGEAVPQNCEQAHMLLHAASLKGSKAADESLKNNYAERCQ